MTRYSYTLIALATAIIVFSVAWAMSLHQDGAFILEAAISGVAVGYLFLQILKQAGARMHERAQQRGVGHE